MIALARTVDRLVEQTRCSESVPRADLQRGDCVIVTTENSIYVIRVLDASNYSISGGWFDRQGVSPTQTSIAGCTWGGSAIKRDTVATCGLRLEFGNRVVTSRIRQILLVRAGDDGIDLRPIRAVELFRACYAGQTAASS
ncbi:MAG: hypothetical protein H7X85_01320 [Thermoanaerobaculia bacterium]|nr:hypothetical protein [Thermoanaerobaculia bacterium]